MEIVNSVEAVLDLIDNLVAKVNMIDKRLCELEAKAEIEMEDTP